MYRRLVVPLMAIVATIALVMVVSPTDASAERRLGGDTYVFGGELRIDQPVSGSVQVYKGNVITNGQSAPGGNADAINSTEMVILNNPPTGVYRVRAIVRSVNQGAAQGMSLVINGRVTPAIPR